MEIDIPLVIAVGGALLLLLGFLVYRNFKDEKEYEEDADDPHALKKHGTKDDLEKRM